jgi:pimeloyl-ACP methyl ester carboxylesterase
MNTSVIFVVLAMACAVVIYVAWRHYDHRVRTVVVGDITMAYRVFGRGKPLVLIGGFGSSMKIWSSSFLSGLMSQYRVIVFDNRGTGLSTLGTKEYSIEQCADDVKGLLDAMGVREIYLFGYSMGSCIAQEFTFKYPSMVKKLIVGGVNALGKEQMPLEAQRSLADLSGSDQDMWHRKLRLMFPEGWLARHKYMFKLVPHFNRETMRKQMNALEQWGGSSDRLNLIKVPTLIVMGVEDTVTPAVNGVYMVQRVAGAWLVQLSDCGHGLIIQEPRKVSHLVSLFLHR